MKFLLPTLGLLALLASPAMADQAFTKDAAKVESGTFAVEPAHTRVTFGVSHFGFTTYYGEFRDASGTLKLNPKSPDASSFNFKVATASVTVPSEKLEGELKGDQWLDAAKFPEITFKSTKVVKTGADTADVTGDFTMHGVTKPLTLSVRFNGAGANPVNKNYTAGFDVSGMLKRTDFGVKTFAPMVGDEVEIKITAAFEKQK